MKNNIELFERIYNNYIFENIFKENKIKLDEVSPVNFWNKILDNRTGTDYAQSVLKLKKLGHETPINLNGNLKNNRYILGDHIISLKNNRFSSNKELNSFLIEKLYEELLLEHGEKAQKVLQSFFIGFKDTLKQDSYQFVPLHFVDYSELIA